MVLKITFQSPEFNRSIIFSKETSMTKKIDQFLRHWIIGERIFLWFNISPRSLPNRYSFCDELAEKRLGGFALAFDRLAKSLA